MRVLHATIFILGEAALHAKQQKQFSEKFGVISHSANLLNVRLKRRQLGFHICFCIQFVV